MFRPLMYIFAYSMGFVFSASVMAAENSQVKDHVLKLDIRLVAESDSPDQIVNTIVFPDFTSIQSATNVNASPNANSNASTKSNSDLSGQEKAAQAKNQAYGLIKENKKVKVKKEHANQGKGKPTNTHKP
jgi:hypothetical protein